MNKEYSELVVDFKIENKLPHFKLYAGIHKTDEYEAFIFEVTDLWHGGQVYTNSFNSSFCPEENRQWFAGVIIRQMKDNIRLAVDAQKAVTRKAWDEFMITVCSR